MNASKNNQPKRRSVATSLKPVRDPYRLIAPAYDFFAASSLRGMHERVASVCLERGVRRILDVGCGTGLLTSVLAGRFAVVAGLDASQAMLHQAQKKMSAWPGPVALVRGSGDRPPFKAGGFDALTYSLVLHETGSKAVEMLHAGFDLAPLAIVLEWRAPERNIDYLLTSWSHGVEFLAGREHYRSFRAFIRQGGVHGLARKVGARVEEACSLWSGCFTLAVLSRR